MHSVHPPFLQDGGGGVAPPTKFSKKEGLEGPPRLEGGCWEKGGNFFPWGWGGGGVQFSHKK